MFAGSYIAEYYIPWSGIVSLQIQLYLPHDTTNILTHDLMTHDSGPVFMLAKLKLPWEQVCTVIKCLIYMLYLALLPCALVPFH